jgi:hypothetical protein
LAPHDFYNDVRYMFPSTLPIGTVVKLQVDSGDNSPWYIINTADFEVAPAAIAQPSGSINAVTSFGADNTGVKDSTTALQNAINAAENATTPGTVYLPAGTYTISNPLSVNNVTVEGAGEWYTVITGSHVEFAGNISPASTNVNVSNLAIFGNVAVRNDGDGTVNGFNGGFSNSTISNVWIQNTKVGAWIVGPATNLTFNNMRIMDLKADGINFNAANGAISGGTVENSFFFNTQDDGVAMWAENAADTNITVNQNTILSPGLANNIAVYGAGQGDEITNNLLEDPVTRGSCFQTSQGVFSSVASSGPVTIQNNVMQRCGVFDPGFFFGTGAVRFWPSSSPLTGPFNLSGNTIDNSAYAAYQFLGPSENPTVTVDGDTVTNVGTFVVHAQGPGSATFTDVTASGVTDGGFLNLGTTTFTVDTSGDTGWSASPAATAIPPGNPLWVYPDIVTFQTTEGTALTEQVAVINAAYQGTTIGAISTSSGFTQTNNCGTSLAAAEYGGASEPGYCIVNVTFNGGGSGITPGTLTIPNSAGNTVNVMLVGSTGGNTQITPPQVSPTSLSFGYLLVGQTAPPQTVTLTNPAGSAAISVSSIVTSTGFTQTNTCGSTLAGGASCTISVKFAPTAAGTFSGSLAITTSASSTPIGVSLSGTAYTSTTNLALGATATASSIESGFPASNANDGNTSSYWESLDGAGYPQTLTLNFGQILPLGSVTLTLPPSTAWATRTETLSVLGSNNGTSWTTIVASANYTFNPSTTPSNTVSFNLPAGTNYQYLQLSFTANTGWTAAQVSEFEVFPGTTSCTTPAAPSALSATAVSSSQINLSWTASSTSGVTYSVFRSTTSGFTASASNQVTSGLTGTTYSNTGLAASTTYYYLVQAVNGCASSASSNQASATTTPSTSATITASPTSLAFGTVSVGSSSAPQTVTLKNTGSAGATISSITAGTGFAETNTCGSSLAAGASCTVSVTFTPTAASSYSASLTVNSNATDGTLTVPLTGTGGGSSTTNLALGATITASSNASGYPATNANDGNTSTYWESLDGSAYPQTLTLNFGKVESLGSVTLTLPPLSAWNTRTETLSVLGSNNGSTWTTVVASAGYTFNPSTTPSNTVSFNLPAGTSYQYLQLSFTANTGWSAAQISEFEVFSGTTGSGEAPFGGTPAAIPGTVMAENYDTGGEGIAYNVTSVNGTDNSYRSDGVDLETATAPATGNDLGWTATGQWFKYTVNVATAGTYTVSFEVASPNGVTDAFHISNSSGTNLSGSVNVTNTGGWQTWTTVTASVTLPAGVQTLTFNQDNAGWNIDNATFAVQ